MTIRSPSCKTKRVFEIAGLTELPQLAEPWMPGIRAEEFPAAIYRDGSTPWRAHLRGCLAVEITEMSSSVTAASTPIRSGPAFPCVASSSP
jgi:hypothetical protein